MPSITTYGCFCHGFILIAKDPYKHKESIRKLGAHILKCEAGRILSREEAARLRQLTEDDLAALAAKPDDLPTTPAPSSS